MFNSVLKKDEKQSNIKYYSGKLTSLSSQKVDYSTKKKPINIKKPEDLSSLKSKLNINNLKYTSKDYKNSNNLFSNKINQTSSLYQRMTDGKYKGYSNRKNSNLSNYSIASVFGFIDEFFAYKKLNAINISYFISTLLSSILLSFLITKFSNNIISDIRQKENLTNVVSFSSPNISYESLFSKIDDVLVDEALITPDETNTNTTKNVKWRDPAISDFPYRIKKGENLYSIIKRHPYLSVKTLINYNNLKDANSIKEGQIIKIPNQNGILYKIKQGDAISLLAKQYGISPYAIYDTNNLKDNVLKSGQVIFLPGVLMSDKDFSEAISKPTKTEEYIIPVFDKYWITSRFGDRNNPFSGEPGDFHHGIDLAVPTGTKVYSTKSGTVISKGFDPRIYGFYVQVKHSDGMVSVYGHLSKILVSTGKTVKQGELIALSGNTGASTGPHLHFEFRKLGPVGYYRVDPEFYIPLFKRK